MLKEAFIIIMFINIEKAHVKIAELLLIKLKNALRDQEKGGLDGLKIILEIEKIFSYTDGLANGGGFVYNRNSETERRFCPNGRRKRSCHVRR